MGFAAALTNIAAARSLRPCSLRGRAARAMRRRMERPGHQRRSDCAVGVRASLPRRGGRTALAALRLRGSRRSHATDFKSWGTRRARGCA